MHSLCVENDIPYKTKNISQSILFREQKSLDAHYYKQNKKNKTGNDDRYEQNLILPVPDSNGFWMFSERRIIIYTTL